jgi:heme/copper-type cytochrome/quinol oxidase subunit 2
MLVPRAICFGLLIVAAGCYNSDRPREVLVVARGLAFTVPSDSERVNPRLTLTAGQRVRVTLRSEAHGLVHDFQIPEWNVKTDQVRGGQSTSVLFVVPAQTGRAKYVSGPHAATVHGVIEVVAP